MVYSKVLISLAIIVGFVVCSAYSQVCTPSEIMPVLDPADLPELPKEFQTRLVGSFFYAENSQKSTMSVILYDYYARRAELIVHDSGKRLRQVYYYDKNEFFTIGNICEFH